MYIYSELLNKKFATVRECEDAEKAEIERRENEARLQKLREETAKKKEAEKQAAIKKDIDELVVCISEANEAIKKFDEKFKKFKANHSDVKITLEDDDIEVLADAIVSVLSEHDHNGRRSFFDIFR